MLDIENLNQIRVRLFKTQLCYKPRISENFELSFATHGWGFLFTTFVFRFKAWFSYASNIPQGHTLCHGLGHRYSICEHLLLNHNLSQALTACVPWSWAEFNLIAGKLAVGSVCRWWKYFMWTSPVDALYSSKMIWSILKVEWLKIVPI